MTLKKSNKKVSKKEDSEDEYEIEDDVNLEDIDEIDNEDLNDEEDDSDEESDDLIIDPDTDTNGCAIDDAINEDDEYFNNIEETELPSEQGSEYVPKEKRISCDRLTNYEMVRILGERTKQLTMGAKPLIKNYQNLSYDKIAEEEFKINMIPFKIKRPLPNGKYEIWTLDELKKDHLFYRLE
jgi:DNA-directed RNA polymerase subunit K/omega